MSGGATLAGVNVVHAEVYMSASGLWRIDAALQDAPDVGTAAMQFVFQSLMLTCTPVRSINYAGQRGLRLIAGMGGWRQTLPPRQYAGTVSLSTVVADAAAAVGEPAPVLATDVALGTAYIRSQGPAVRVLDLLPLWWADFTGTVQSATRDASPITSTFTLLDVKRAEGSVSIATDSIQDWTPGRTFSTAALSGTINSVMHEIHANQVRTFAFLPNLVAGQVVSS